MSKRGDVEFLSDIKEAIRRIEFYIENINYERFLKDIKTQDAVVRNLEIIGEATKTISEKLRKKYPKVPWKNLARARNRLIHHYFGVNYDVVWGIVTQELPEIILQVEEILNKETKEEND